MKRIIITIMACIILLSIARQSFAVDKIRIRMNTYRAVAVKDEKAIIHIARDVAGTH